ncbi:MAG TPA: anti-sigma factor [Acidimicrobiia bacterium]|nr:anti-sigma factor [Acidimicrobiia bacterium]
MARELTPRELEQLLGVYALDALDDGEERAQVELHLDRVPSARGEVAELREVAAVLASSGSPPPPAGLWERIEAALEAEPPRLVLPLAAARETRARRGIGIRVAAAVAAASAVAAATAALVITDEMSQQEDRLALVEAQVGGDGTRRAALAAMASPQARMAHLEPVDAGAPPGVSATVVTMPGGDAYLMAEHLPRLAPGRTYQLWAMTGDHGDSTLLSTAILGRRVDVVAFHAPGGSLGFLITDEEAPGATTSVRPRVLAGEFA